MRPLLVILLGTSSLLAPRVADACSPPQCEAGGLAPGAGTASPVPTVPANLPAIVWRPMRSFDGNAGDPAMVTLATSTDPTTPLALTATEQPTGNYLLVPQQPLVDGTTYVVTDGNECFGSPGPKLAFKAGPAAPLPTQLGELLPGLHEFLTLGVGSSGGACSSPVDAMTTKVSVVLSAEAMPWYHALHFETLVDGQRWTANQAFQIPAPGASSLGRGIDMLFRTCASDDMFASQGLGEGPHEVTMRATLPGKSFQMTLPPVTIELTCPTPDTCERDPELPECKEPLGEPGGCSTNGGRGGWLVLAIALLLVRRSRTRSRRPA